MARAAGVSFGVLGDTHLFSEGAFRRLWDRWLTGESGWEGILLQLKELWQGIEGVFHTGDIAHPRVLSSLEEVLGVPVLAVRGNADRGAWAKALPPLRVETILGQRIALIHGWGSPRYLIDRIAARIGWEYQAVLFGHSHQPFLKTLEGVLWLNPGSPTDRRFAPYRSVAKLIVTSQEVKGELIRLPEQVKR